MQSCQLRSALLLMPPGGTLVTIQPKERRHMSLPLNFTTNFSRLFKMLRMKTMVPALVLLGSLVPLAANARRMVSPSPQPTSMLVQVSSAQPTNPFSLGRRAELPSYGQAQTHETTQYALVNIDAAPGAKS